uniref:Ankyrin repeat protein n=1 Tax=Trypanosoma congolense (strain IL3000) TaxID=1068625 RepID=G0UXK1_TRYCI|nr:conserved hypothetical protein [Trypanosoma congolense IL3000]
MLRPRDLCTAAYYDDVERMKQLVYSHIQEEEEEVSEGSEEGTEEDVDMDMINSLREMRRVEKHREKVAQLLQSVGPLQVEETKEQYGFSFRATETASDNSLKIEFKLSKKSKYPAAPLHWAVLGRSHEAVRYLVKRGVDVQQQVPDFPDVTANKICVCNKSYETARVLEESTKLFRHRAKERKGREEALVKAIEDDKREREEQAARLREEEEEQEEGEEGEGEGERDEEDGGDSKWGKSGVSGHDYVEDDVLSNADRGENDYATDVNDG